MKLCYIVTITYVARTVVRRTTVVAKQCVASAVLSPIPQSYNFSISHLKSKVIFSQIEKFSCNYKWHNAMESVPANFNVSSMEMLLTTFQ